MIRRRMLDNFGWLIAALATSLLVGTTTPDSPLTNDSEFQSQGERELARPQWSRRDDGAKIYREQCASCHGKNGEGVKGPYDEPLRGFLTIEKLAQLIEETMPEEDPDACVGEDARAVAAFIHKTFYRGHTQPKVRRRLVRLTENQFRQSIADVIAMYRGQHFLSDVKPRTPHGLEATYYHARNFNNKKKVKSRIDGTVKFDFGSGLPDVIPPPAKETKKKNNLEYDPNEFSIRWSGGIIVDQTGDYELIVRSQNGFRFYLNRMDRPIIDQTVTSGESSHRASMYLLGGRVYPLRLDFFRFKDKTSSIQLCWKTPNGVERIIPENKLVVGWRPSVGLLDTQFPADDSSLGFPSGISVSQQWYDAVTESSVKVSRLMVSLANSQIRKNGEWNPVKINKLKTQLNDFVERLFGRPLTDAERNFHVDQFFEKETPVEESIKQVVILAITSPQFLYPNLDEQKLDSDSGFSLVEQRVARKASLYLWDSLQSNELGTALRKGSFLDRQSTRKQIWRMLQHERARDKLGGFFEYWLHLQGSEPIDKDKKLFPGFDQAMAADLRQSLQLMVDRVFWSDNSDFRQLFLSDEIPVNARLRFYYGLDSTKLTAKQAKAIQRVQSYFGIAPSSDVETKFESVRLGSKRNGGILTHPYLLAQFSYYKNTSPIHRGEFVARSLLGRALPPPPDDVDPLTEDAAPTMTTRQRVEHQTRPTACMNCHQLINPLGFALEDFDAVGKLRDHEKDRPIDSLVEFRTSKDETIRFDGYRDLAEYLAQSEDAQKSFIRHLFQHLVKQPIEAYGPDAMGELHRKFKEDRFHMQKLVVHVVEFAVYRELKAR